MNNPLSEEFELTEKKANEESLIRGMKSINNDMFLLAILQMDSKTKQIISDITSPEILIQAIKDKYAADEIHMESLPTDKLVFDADAKKAVQFAIMQRAYFNPSGQVDNSHLLLGIIKEASSFAAELLAKYEITEAKVSDYITGATKIDPATATTNNKKKGKQSLLENFSINFNELAKENKLKPVIGRQKEIDRCFEILGRFEKNNPILVGEPGVGKTAIAEGLAIAIVKGECPFSFKDKVIFNLNINSVVSGTKYRGEFEERMKMILAEIKKNPNHIIFIDEFHTAVGAGNGERGLDVANIIKPALARGEFQTIAATTFEEYKQIEKDAAFERRFQKVTIDEPNATDALAIIKSSIGVYEKHHKLKYESDAIEEAVALSDRYISDRRFPDKGFDLIDESGSRVKLKVLGNDELISKQTKLKQLVEALETEKNNKNFSACAAIKKEITTLEVEINETHSVVTKKDIQETLSTITGIPLTEVNKDELERLYSLDANLKQRVIGQNEVIDRLSFALKRNGLGIRDFKKPIGRFLFLGLSGVGKTYLVKMLAKEIFGSEDEYIRFDMSEYSERIDSSKLIGAAPGYVGYESGGQLTEKVRRKPYCVLLFDEIEKAHPDITNLLLQVLDEGVLTDSLGKKTNFKNTIIIFTSNVGASRMVKKNAFGFGALDEDAKSAISKDIKNAFRKEFLNRLDEFIIFNTLNKEDILKILELSIIKMQERFNNLELTISLSDEVKKVIADKGYNEEFGVRELDRTLEREIENKIVQEFLEKRISKGNKLEAILDEKKEIIIRAI